MNQLPGTGCVVSEEQKLTYAGIYMLKKMDMKPEEGGITVPVVLPSELSPLDETMQQLMVDDLIQINRRKGNYEITKKGYSYIAMLIDEAEALIDEFDELEVDEMLEILEARNLDPFRVRFLWGWYQGELDDLVVYQQRRGISPIEQFWAFFLMSDDFYNNLALELG